MPVLATKLYVPPPRPGAVLRPRLIERLNDGLRCKLTLVSAPAGFGKTTLVSEWVAGRPRPATWLSLDEGDGDPARFLTYLIAALQRIAAGLGQGLLAVLQSPQPPPTEAILTALLNEIANIPDSFVLVIDDYHAVDARPVDQALIFLLEHLPSQMHLVIATREDPQLPLARLRARGQLSELRVADLRFTTSEAAEFLNQAMGLRLSADDVVALEGRTEGWIAGLQLAALSMKGLEDAAGFIRSFTGSHRFVLDYLTEEVLRRQSESVQTFLLRTSILDRLCGPLCDAVMLGAPGSGQETLEYLERANLFVVPLDDERRWYRYHHLFAELLRQRLRQDVSRSTGDEEKATAELHVRASQWYEDNDLAIDAFRHAAAANDVERAERLIESGRIPTHFRSAVIAILDWLGSLPKSALDARPKLWYRYGSLSLAIGLTAGVEERLNAAERGLQDAEPDAGIRNLIGQIAGARATLALSRYQADTIIVQARRALEYLPPDNLRSRFTAFWTMAFAHRLHGDRAASRRAYAEAFAISQVSGDAWSAILATSSLGDVQELDNQLHTAAETYRQVLRLAGDHPLPSTTGPHLGLARIAYEWDDLDAAEQHARQSLQSARLYDKVVDRFVVSEVFLARLRLARGDVAGAAADLAQTEQTVREHGWMQRMPDVAAVQLLTLLRQGNVLAAADLAQTHNLPLCQARVHLAQGDPAAALAVLAPLREQMEAKGWEDERLKVMVLQAVALHQSGDAEQAVRLVGVALALAQPEGFVRLFVDEGAPMAELLSAAVSRGIHPDYAGKLLAALRAEQPKGEDEPGPTNAQRLSEPLSQRELEVLRLIAQGLSNQEIGQRLYLALDTVKGHNRRIFDKLQAQRRTDAVVRARELGLL
jgi:LuxR family transcriptional regulator, maltose regulon positive regulatory protein